MRDGLVSSLLGIVWPESVGLFCKPGGIVCDFLQYSYHELTWPAQATIGKLLELIFRVSGIVTATGDVTVSNRAADWIALGLGIPLVLIYWFLLGALTCKMWRIVRTQLQLALAKRSHQS